MIDWKIISLIFRRRAKREGRKQDNLKMIQRRRKHADAKIAGMIAQINGCGDRWFLCRDNNATMDECKPRHPDGDES